MAGSEVLVDTSDKGDYPSLWEVGRTATGPYLLNGRTLISMKRLGILGYGDGDTPEVARMAARRSTLDKAVSKLGGFSGDTEKYADAFRAAKVLKRELPDSDGLEELELSTGALVDQIRERYSAACQTEVEQLNRLVSDEVPDSLFVLYALHHDLWAAKLAGFYVEEVGDTLRPGLILEGEQGTPSGEPADNFIRHGLYHCGQE